MSNDLTDIVGRHDFPFDTRQELMTALYAREDAALHMLVHAGMQFGLYPQIVQEMLAQTGLGTPLAPEQRQEIRRNYETLIEQLKEQG